MTAPAITSDALAVEGPGPAGLSPDDTLRLARLFDRTFGSGFKLTVIEASSPVRRMAILEELRPIWLAKQARIVELDVTACLQATPDREREVNLWAMLRTEVQESVARDKQTLLVLHSFEQADYGGIDDAALLVPQVNVQRDVLVRDFPVWWVMFLHPSARQRWQRVAPDWCDFVALWVEEQPGEAGDLGLVAGMDGGAVGALSVTNSYPSAWPEDLRRALGLVDRFEFQEAMDLVETHRARVGAEKDVAIVGLVRARAAQRKGELNWALDFARREVLPAFEAAGDEWGVAETWDLVADVLEDQGELDEALRIWRDEALPVYGHVEDARSEAVTMGKIAKILYTRGRLEEARQIMQDELAVYSRLGDLRSKAVALADIADALGAQGQLDEAERILTQDVLPAFENLRDDRGIAVTMGRIAEIYRAHGKFLDVLRIHRECELPVYERLGDARQRIAVLGSIADILQVLGHPDEALRIRREEEVPFYEQLGDVRSRATVMSKVADILSDRRELDEALRILREEVLPVVEALGDVRGIAVTMGQVAEILQARGQFDDAVRTRKEMELPVFERLGDVRNLLIARANLARDLHRRGLVGDEAECRALLTQAHAAAVALRIPEADQIAKLYSDIFGKPLPQ